jgi:hypothetical protein
VHAGVRDLADLRCRESAHGGAGEGGGGLVQAGILNRDLERIPPGEMIGTHPR